MSVNKEQEPQPALTRDQVREAVRIEDTRLLDNVYELAESQVERAEAHRAALDEKAGQLLGITAGTFSLAFTIGGLFLEKVLLSGPAVNLVSHNLACSAWAVWWGALFLTLTAIFCCYKAYKARSEYRGVHDVDIFRADVLRPKNGQADVKGYKRFMAPAFWEVAHNNHKVTECKGKWLKAAQWLFLISLCGMVTAGALASWAAMQQKSDKPISQGRSN
jgi:hypothetical protein